MASSGDSGASESLVESVVEQVVTWSFITDLPGIPKPLAEFFRDPEGKVREWVLNIVIAAVANVVFTTTDLITEGLNAVLAPFTTVRVNVTKALWNGETEEIDSAGEALVVPITDINDWVATGFADALGFGGFPILVTIYVVEIALFVRVGRAAIPALSNAAGAIPVIGSVIDGIVTFGYRLLGGSR